MKIDAVILNLVQKVGPGIPGWIVSAAHNAPENRKAARMAKCRAEVTNDVSQLVTAALKENLVIRIFDVPVIQQDHHHFQTLKLPAANKRISIPLPSVKSLDAFATCFEPDVLKRSFSRNHYSGYQIINLSHIAGCP